MSCFLLFFPFCVLLMSFGRVVLVVVWLLCSAATVGRQIEMFAVRATCHTPLPLAERQLQLANSVLPFCLPVDL